MKNKKIAFITSVGRQTEPILKSLAANNPAYIIFLCSQGTVEFATCIKKHHIKEGYHPTSVNYVIIEGQNGHESLDACYDASLKCAALLEEIAPNVEQVLVDYTTGTRSMTAALAIMSIKENFDLIYVGGETRSEGGLGIVQSGTEKIHQFQSPWKRLAYLQKQRLITLFNQHQYQTCLTNIEELLQDSLLDPQEKTLMFIFQDICKGYADWDRFDHSTALSPLIRAQEKLKNNPITDSYLSPLLNNLTQHVELLKKLKALHTKKDEPNLLRASDLYSNALRRYKENKYDDAVARLYRLIEMCGQIDLYEHNEELTHKYPISKIPSELQEEYRKRCVDKNNPGLVRLGLKDTYQLLNIFERPLGKKFEQLRGDYDRLMIARNQSILAHGNIPLSKEKADKYLELVEKLYTPTESIEFPTLKNV